MKTFFDQKTGELIKPGRLTKTFTYEFKDEANEIEVIGASKEITSRNVLVCKSTGTNIKVNLPSVDCHRLDYIKFTVNGFMCKHNTNTIKINLGTEEITGIGLRNKEVIDFTNNVSEYVHYLLSDTSTLQNIPRNISILAMIKNKEIFIMEDDQVISYADQLDFSFSGEIVPSIEVYKGDVKPQIAIDSFEIELNYNRRYSF